MLQRALTSGVLMEVSESRIDSVRQSGSVASQLVVKRLLDTPVVYDRWRSFHYGLMKDVAASGTWKAQLAQLRKTSFVLLHRQAMFDYLRASRVTGRDREAIIAAFYGSTNYSRAVITEHDRYLQSNSSLFCTDHLEWSVMSDRLFSTEMSKYRQAYREFFALYAGWIVAEARGREYPLQVLMPEMKTRLLTMKSQLMATPFAAESEMSRRSTPAAARGTLGRLGQDAMTAARLHLFSRRAVEAPAKVPVS